MPARALRLAIDAVEQAAFVDQLENKNAREGIETLLTSGLTQ